LVCSLCVGLFFWQVESFLLTPDQVNYWMVSDLDNSIIVTVDIILVTVIPLIASYKNVQSVPTPDEAARSSGSNERFKLRCLEEVLGTTPGYNAFFSFLSKEWSTENLLFWKEVNEFKANENPEKRKEKAIEIYEKYVRENGMYQVNLSSINRSKTQANVRSQDDSTTIFDDAQEEIF